MEKKSIFRHQIKRSLSYYSTAKKQISFIVCLPDLNVDKKKLARDFILKREKIPKMLGFAVRGREDTLLLVLREG